MALTITTINDQPAVSLLLVKPADQGQKKDPIDLIPVNNDETSRADLMELIYLLMLLVGKNMSEIQTVYAQSQLDQDKIAQNQASATYAQVGKFMKELEKLKHEQEKAQKWEIFGKVMKWIGVAVGLLVGALLCESPLGFIVLAAVVAFSASPLFDKAVSALGGAIGKAIGNSTWGKILAQAVILVSLTVLTCGAEGLSTGLTKLATTAGEDAAQGGTQAAAQVAKQTAEDVAEEAAKDVAKEVSEQTTSQTSKIAENASNKVSAKDFKPRWSYSSAAVSTTTLMSTNLLGELITQGVQRLPINEKAKEWMEITLTIAADLLATFASFKAASNAGNLMQQLGNPKLVKAGLFSFVAASQATTSVANGSCGYYEYEQGLIQKSIAETKANIAFGQGFFQILTQLANLAQQTYKSTMDSNTIIFNTNFSADWQACVAAQQYQA